MKNTSRQGGEYTSLEGNPAPTDAVLPKGSKLSQAASDTLTYSLTTISIFQLYANMADYNISPEEYANLLDSAAPGTKAKIVEMAKSKAIVAAPTKFTEAIKDPNIKKLYDWAIAQG